MSTPEKQIRPAANGTDSKSLAEGDTSIVCENCARSDYLDPHHVFAAFAEGTGRYWRRRAAQWDDARPREGDFTGRATRDELRVRWDRATAKAAACRGRAEIAERYGATDVERAMIAGIAESMAVAA